MVRKVPNSTVLVAPLARTARLLVSWRLLRFAAPAYILLMLVVWGVLLSAWLGGRNGRDSSGVVLGPDFTAFYTGGWLVRHEDYPGLYDLEHQASVQRSILPGFRGVSAYLNPPHYAMLLVPFSAMPYSLAFALWTGLMIATFIAAVGLLWPVLPALHSLHGRLFAVALLVSPPVYYAISAGQNTGLTLMLHAAILVALVQRRDVLAGALIALGMLKPQLFIGLLPLLLLGRRWPALVGFSAVSSLISVLVVWSTGFGTVERWLALLGSNAYQSEIDRQVAKMYSWQSFFTLLLGPSSGASILGWSAGVVVFSCVCYLWWREIGDVPLRYSITLLGVMAMGPHLFVYDLGLLVLPSLVLTDRLLSAPAKDWVWLRLGLLALYVMSFFAARSELSPGLVVMPLLAVITWGAAGLARAQAPVMQLSGGAVRRRSRAV